MGLTNVSLTTFLCCAKGEGDALNSIDVAISVYSNSIGRKLFDLGPEYAIHEILFGDDGDRVLLHNGIYVGSYIGPIIVMDTGHSDEKLSTPLILSAIADREDLPANRILSVGGEAVFTKAYRVFHGCDKCRWPLPPHLVKQFRSIWRTKLFCLSLWFNQKFIY
jgi:hypothetical protein